MDGLNQILYIILVPLILVGIEVIAVALSRPGVVEARPAATQLPKHRTILDSIWTLLWSTADAGITLCVGAVGTDVGVLAHTETLDRLGIVLFMLHVGILLAVAWLERRLKELTSQLEQAQEYVRAEGCLRIRVLAANGLGLLCQFTAFSYSTSHAGVGWTVAVAIAIGTVVMIVRAVRRYMHNVEKL